MSSGATPAFLARRKTSSANATPNSSRPVDFGGRRRRKGCASSSASSARVNASAPRQPAAVVVVPLAVRYALGHAVDHHVARAGVEGEHVADLRPGRHPRHVGDAADVLDRAAPARMAEEQVVGVRDQRRALAAGGDVARAEVRHGRDAGPLGDDGRLADLERRARVPPPGPSGLRKMADRLPVRADQVNRAERYPARPRERDQRPGEQFAEDEVQPADLIQPSRLRLEQRENALPDLRRIRERAKRQRADAARRNLARSRRRRRRPTCRTSARPRAASSFASGQPVPSLAVSRPGSLHSCSTTATIVS